MRTVMTTLLVASVLLLASAPLAAQPAEPAATPDEPAAQPAEPAATPDEPATPAEPAPIPGTGDVPIPDVPPPGDTGLPETPGGQPADASLPETPEEAPADDSPSAPNVIGVGIKAGVALPQLSSELDTNFAVHLELTYLMPFWGSRFGLYTAGGNSMPTASGTGEDPRLPSGTYSWELTQFQTIWDLGLTLRVMPWECDWNVGFLAGSRMTFVSTLTNGKAEGQSFGEHDEQGTLYGAFVSVLGEYRLGPGSLFGELNYSLKLQDLRTTGDLPLSEMTILVGYRFDFAI